MSKPKTSRGCSENVVFEKSIARPAEERTLSVEREREREKNRVSENVKEGENRNRVEVKGYFGED